MESSVSSSENLKDSLTGLQSILMKKLLDDHDNRGSVTGLSPEVIKAYKGSPTFEHLESIKEVSCSEHFVKLKCIHFHVCSELVRIIRPNFKIKGRSDFCVTFYIEK